MIFIVVKFKTKPEWTDKWLDLVHDFTHATREEPEIFGLSGLKALTTHRHSCL